MKRKLLSLILALVLIMQTFPMVAMAEEPDTAPGISSATTEVTTPGVSGLPTEDTILGESSLTVEDNTEAADIAEALTVDTTVWDGKKETKPAKDESGVYQIGTAAELAWFRTYVNVTAGSDANAVLTADIDLGGYEWIPISTRSNALEKYKGTFDGQFHTVSGLSVNGTTANQGFFADVNGATIKNLLVEGNVSGSSNYVGGIVGTTRDATVFNCSFAGTVTYTGSGKHYIGGIVGGNQTTKSIISGCVNRADVMGYTAGGIMGYSTQANTIENCYNTGTITGSNRSGGIIGQATAGTIRSCYNIGAIEGEATTCGGIYGFFGATLTDCYHLYPEVEAPGGTPSALSSKITAPEELGNLLSEGVFVNSNGANGGYPLLSWQASSDTPPDEAPAISLKGDSTLHVQQGVGQNETTLSVVLRNIEANDIDSVSWQVETQKGSLAPEDIVGWQTAEEDEIHLIVTAKSGGVVSVTATVEVYGETLTATRTISVVPKITTAQIVSASENGAVAMGQTVKVKVSVLGGGEYDYENYPELSYEWRHNATSPSANIPGATARSFAVPTTADYSEWQWLYVEIKSGGAVVKEAQDVRAQLRSEDYGKLYPVAYDETFALPSKIKDDKPLTLPAVHTLNDVTANVTWTSDKPEVITASGAVTRPAVGTVDVTLTANYRYGTAFANRDFKVTVYSDEAAGSDKTNLQEAAELLSSYSPIVPVYGNDSNLATMAKSYLAAKGYEDLTVKVKTVTPLHDGGSIAPNGDLSYFYADPNGSRGLWFGQYGVEFTLAEGDESADVSQTAVNLHWDRNKAQETMRREILSGVTDAVVFGGNESLGNVVSDLTLPKIVDGKKWAQVTWSSSDSGVLLVSSENQGTADTLFAPYVGKVIRGQEDKEVTLTAKFIFNRTTWGEQELVLYKTFTFTVKALTDTEANAVRARLLQKLEAGFNAVGIKDYVTGKELTEEDGVYIAANDLQLPTTRDFGVDGKFFPVTMTSSDADTMTVPEVANAARVTVYRPTVDDAAKAVTLTVTITDLAQGIAASKKFTIKVLPLTQTEVDDALALMDRAKSAYFEGLSAGKYKDEFSVTGGLHSFREAVWNADKTGLRWVYDRRNATRSGIIADELDNWAEQEAWRTFRSGEMDILDHETLNYGTQPAEDTFVRINSTLTHEVYGKYAGRPEYVGFEQLYRQPVSVYVMVAGKNHPQRTPAELLQMQKEAVAKISAPISAEFTLFGTKAQTRVRRAAVATASFGDPIIQTTVGGLEAGTTVFGLFREALAQQGYTYKAVGSYVKSVTDADGNTLAERDAGPNSGWIYTVNGKLPSIYMNGYSLKEGDEVEVRFTDDYTKEDGFGKGDSGQGSTGGGATAPATPGVGVIGTTKESSPATPAQATSAVAEAAQHGGARMVNVTCISPVIAGQIAMDVPAGTKIFADTVMGSSIVGRMYLDPLAVSKQAGPIDTRIDITEQGTAPVGGVFKQYFSNTMAFVQLGQTGPFGMSVSVALRLNLTGMSSHSLHAYVYDAVNNTYIRLPAPRVDRNGFVHLTTTKGGALIVTDKPLTRR